MFSARFLIMFSKKESTPPAFLRVQYNGTLFCHQITMTSKMRNFIAKRLSEIIEVAPATRNYFESRLLGMKVLSTASTIVI